MGKGKNTPMPKSPKLPKIDELRRGADEGQSGYNLSALGKAAPAPPIPSVDCRQF